MVTGTFLVGPVSDPSTLPCPSPAALFNKEPASSQTRVEETVLMPGMLGAWKRVGCPARGGARGVAKAGTTRARNPPAPITVTHFRPSQPHPYGPHQLSSCQRTCLGRSMFLGGTGRKFPLLGAPPSSPVLSSTSWGQSTCSVPATLLGAGDTAMGATDTAAALGETGAL